MTVKTLTYIHNLLKEQVDKYEHAKKWISEIYYKAVEDNASNVETLHKEYDKAKEKYYEACHALEDFEGKEW